MECDSLLTNSGRGMNVDGNVSGLIAVSVHDKFKT